jgi:polyhydroxybutyrate depolymerase
MAPTTMVPTTTLPPDCTGLAGVASGRGQYVGADGQQRRYEIDVPSGYDGRYATPLILNFHEHSSNGAQHDTYTEMGSQGTERGYIVISPDSSSPPPSWNVRDASNRLDDFAFAHGLVAELQSTMCIDGGRIYAAGHANGGMFAAALACSAPYEFAAVAVVAAVPRPSCPPDVQPDFLQILGTADELTVYEGTDQRPGAYTSIESWAVHAGCADPPIVEMVADGVELLSHKGCTGADVDLLTVIGGAHPWPGGRVARNREGNSRAGRTFPATETVLDFFDAHVAA